MKNKNLDSGYGLIPLNKITPEARELAVRWVEGYESSGFDLPGKHKLASDIMNYAKKYAAAQSKGWTDEDMLDAMVAAASSPNTSMQIFKDILQRKKQLKENQP